MLDLHPAVQTLTALLPQVGDDQLDAPTPCPDMSVGDLLDHIDGLAVAFTDAARKTVATADGPPPPPDAGNLGDAWRQRIPSRLVELADAWSEPGAWDAMTAAGGLELPGAVAGHVALDEVVVHGWDLAVATGQGYDGDPELLEALHAFVAPWVADAPDGTPGLFGPPVAVPDDAPLIDRIVGLTGREPRWSAEAVRVRSNG